MRHRAVGQPTRRSSLAADPAGAPPDAPEPTPTLPAPAAIARTVAAGVLLSAAALAVGRGARPPDRRAAAALRGRRAADASTAPRGALIVAGAGDRLRRDPRRPAVAVARAPPGDARARHGRHRRLAAVRRAAPGGRRWRSSPSAWRSRATAAARAAARDELDPRRPARAGRRGRGDRRRRARRRPPGAPRRAAETRGDPARDAARRRRGDTTGGDTPAATDAERPDDARRGRPRTARPPAGATTTGGEPPADADTPAAARRARRRPPAATPAGGDTPGDGETPAPATTPAPASTPGGDAHGGTTTPGDGTPRPRRRRTGGTAPAPARDRRDARRRTPGPPRRLRPTSPSHRLDDGGRRRTPTAPRRSCATTTPRSTSSASTTRGPCSAARPVALRRLRALEGRLREDAVERSRRTSRRPTRGDRTIVELRLAALEQGCPIARNFSVTWTLEHASGEWTVTGLRASADGASVLRIENVDHIDILVILGRHRPACVLRGSGHAGPSLDGVPPSAVRSHARRTIVGFVTATRGRGRF